ncbi:unnamed protein product [Anisakis simplex]|uniref:Uncharacterized protein n=1 Tax=Anisakis simplex TaxID=6269 RepID=A0A0M3KH06_ANISI|nr:unnamed protein product [Anisakis simplex]
MPKISPTTVDSTKLPIVDHKRATNDLYFDDSMDSEKSTAAPVSYHHRHQQQQQHLNRHQYQLRDDDCLPNTSTDVSSSKHLIASERVLIQILYFQSSNLFG